MPRLRNIQSGAVVSCSEETATRLGAEWQPADKPAATALAASRPESAWEPAIKRQPAKRAARKPSKSE